MSVPHGGPSPGVFALRTERRLSAAAAASLRLGWEAAHRAARASDTPVLIVLEPGMELVPLCDASIPVEAWTGNTSAPAGWETLENVR